MTTARNAWLVEEELTHVIIGAFFRVYTVELHRSASRQLLSYLRATSLEVGFLLHFGPEAKFYRLYAPNAKKTHRPNQGHPSNPQ